MTLRVVATACRRTDRRERQNQTDGHVCGTQSPLSAQSHYRFFLIAGAFAFTASSCAGALRAALISARAR